MKLKKIVSLIVAALMVLTMTACGSSGTSSGTGSGSSDSEDSLWNRTFEGVKLRRLLWYEPTEREKALVKEFTDRTGCTIVDEVVDYENYNAKIADSISSGDPYDIGYIYGAFFPTQIIANMYQPITQYIQSDYLLDSSSAETIAKGGFDISKMDFYKWNNNYYGFSSYWDVDILVMYYRTDLFTEQGLKTPKQLAESGEWNLDTFYDAAYKLTNTRTGMAGYSAGGENTRGYGEFVAAFGGQIVTYDSNGIPSENLNDSKVLNGLNFVKKLTNGATAAIIPDTSFRKGTAAMSIDNLYEAPKMMNNTNVPNSVKNNWDIAPIPLSADNAGAANPTDWLRAIGIVNGCKNPDAVAAFALHMTQDKGDNVWEDYLTEDQIAQVTPYYGNINFANYGYGSLVEDYSTMMGRIATGDDVSQLISEYRTVFKAQIDKIING